MSTAQRKASTASPSSPGGGAFGPGRPRALTPVAVNGPAGGVGGRASSLSSAGTPAATTPRALHAKPSAALKPACDNPFAKPSAGATPFSAAYSGGHVPARIQHSAVHHTLAWSRPPADLPFDPLLLLCCEGLREVVQCVPLTLGLTRVGREEAN